jgi:(p)ppGpp synthase/HD superfamily hydrolase
MQCAACLATIPDGQQRYTLRVDLFAAVDNLDLTEEEIERDRSDEIRQLIERLSKMEPEEIKEESERIFERRVFTLCAVCRASLHDLLSGDPAGWIH